MKLEFLKHRNDPNCSFVMDRMHEDRNNGQIQLDLTVKRSGILRNMIGGCPVSIKYVRPVKERKTVFKPITLELNNLQTRNRTQMKISLEDSQK